MITRPSSVLMMISQDEVERAKLMSEFKYEVDTRTHINHTKNSLEPKSNGVKPWADS